MKTPITVLFVALSFALMSCSQEQRQQQEEVSDPDTASQIVTATPEDVTEEPAPAPECVLRMGFDVWEPYQYVDVNNEVRGLDIELISSVTESMGCDVEFVQGTWVSLLEELANGNVDMLLGASKTEAREDFAYFSQPYRSEEFVLYVRTDEPKFQNFETIEDFVSNGSRIGIVSEYFYGDEMSNLLDGEQFADQFVFGIMGEMNVARLLDMDIDAYLEDSFVGDSIIRRKALEEYIEPHNIRIKTGDIYVMFSQASVPEEKVELFDQALADYKLTTTYAGVLEKYRR
ncbi:MAG: transporter substrate-binding domain-containing protein [Pseudomonadota bacterium]